MNRLLIVVALFFVFAACQPKMEKAPKIGMEDFFRNPEKSGFRISPNGQMIIYRAPLSGRMNVFCSKARGHNSSRYYTRN